MSDSSTNPGPPEPEPTGTGPPRSAGDQRSQPAEPAGDRVYGPGMYAQPTGYGQQGGTYGQQGGTYGQPDTPGSAYRLSQPPGSAYGQGYGPPPGGYGAPVPWQPEPARPTRAAKVIGILAGVAVVAACSAVAGGVVGAWTTQQLTGAPGPAETRVIDGPQLDRPSLASIASEVQPSVVSIDVGPGQGSGVVMDDDGHILTNAHVVAAGTGQVTVRFSNGQQAQALVIGADDRSDIAVVQAQDPPELSPAEFGDSSEVLVGDTVLALGSPLGLQGTVTQGIISALDRTLSPQGGHSLSGLLQTDAAINRGNSGGPLVNLSGEVIGINTAIAVENQESGFLGVGFAVPSERALSVAEQLIAGEDVQHAFLGVAIDPVADGGALIVNVESGSPADDAGIQEGDVVVGFGDRTINDANDLISAVQASSVGDTVDVTIERDGETVTVTVTLGEHAD